MSTIREKLVDGLAKALGVDRTPEREPRMYVCVRADIAPGYQMAQAAHAVSYLAAESKLSLYQHPVITILNVSDEKTLLATAEKHVHTPGDPELFIFREPDLNNEATAFACYSQGKEFSGLPLALRGL